MRLVRPAVVVDSEGNLVTPYDNDLVHPHPTLNQSRKSIEQQNTPAEGPTEGPVEQSEQQRRNSELSKFEQGND